jgi:hypothetical protein
MPHVSQHCFHATHPVTVVFTLHTQLLLFPSYVPSQYFFHATHPVTVVPMLHTQSLLFPRYTPSQCCSHATHPVTVVPRLHALSILFSRYTRSYCCSHATRCHVILSVRFFQFLLTLLFPVPIFSSPLHHFVATSRNTSPKHAAISSSLQLTDSF